jgi:hypothetical protein
VNAKKVHHSVTLQMWNMWEGQSLADALRAEQSPASLGMSRFRTDLVTADSKSRLWEHGRLGRHTRPPQASSLHLPTISDGTSVGWRTALRIARHGKDRRAPPCLIDGLKLVPGASTAKFGSCSSPLASSVDWRRTTTRSDALLGQFHNPM